VTSTSILRPFPFAWYQRPTLAVARDLLGAVFIRNTPEGMLTGMIVEVEAYHGASDEASHACRGRTARNDVMFHAGGALYVYFTYGMHFCMNVVTEAEGLGAAVLIRGVEPREGVDIMRRSRGEEFPLRALTNGPAKCCQAFGVGREQNGASLLGPEFMVVPGNVIPDEAVARSPRIGIRRSADLPWRFSIRGNPFVSKPGL
jgi:DNA-3-methyladenine glycosylase